jgi:AraC-like DNA-binding protein
MGFSTEIHHSHGDFRPSSRVRENSRIWSPRGKPQLELLHGRYKNFNFSRHFHSVVSIGVVEQGPMTCHWEGKDYEAGPDTVILFNAGDVHAPGGQSNRPWSFRMLYLGAHLATELLEHDRPFTKPFVAERHLAKAVLKTHRGFQDDVAMEAESSLVSLIAALQPYTGLKKPEAVVGSSQVRRAQEYIRQRCAQNISLQELATEIGISPFHLVRSFRKHCGVPPHVYLTQMRIEQAQALLRSGVTIAEVAIQTGFVDQSHLTRHFKRFVGVTPGQYS